ncbi:MAG TPA: tetratricopeptide repeat protein [Verrucomicrobiota bacterium]|nr:tetratricopeptide repeat protein [Verrucomicrobiota bacterium]
MTASRHKSGARAAARPAIIDRPLVVTSVLLALAALLTYLPARQCDFIGFDDHLYVTENPNVNTGLNWKNIAWAFNAGYASNWHPLTWMSHMLDVELFGLNPAGHHMVNVLFHTANTVLLFLLMRRMTGLGFQSAFVAALFALHPLHVESVAWVSERKDVLSTFFGLLALIYYVRYAQTQIVNQKSRIINYLLALLCFSLGLMSKPMLVTWPMVMLLLDYWPLKRLPLDDARTRARQLILEKTPFLILAAASCVVTYHAQNRSGAVTSVNVISIAERLQNTPVAYVNYLLKTFWPVDLAVYYPYTAHAAWQVIASAVIVAVVTVAAVFFLRRQPFVPVGWFWYLGMLVPVIGLVQVSRQAMADRYTYVPLVGIFILVTWGAMEMKRRWRLASGGMFVLASVVLLTCATLTRAQLSHWRNTESLFVHTLAVTSENEVSLTVMSRVFNTKGRMEESVALCRRALEINPDYPLALSDMGMMLARKGEFDEALDYFNRALRTMPDPWSAHNNIGITLVRMGRVDDGIESYKEALRLKPDLAVAHHNLAMAYVIQGRLTDAVENFQAAIRHQPGYAPAHKNLGATYARLGRRNEAIRAIQEALRIDPNYLDALQLLQSLRSPPGRDSQ